VSGICKGFHELRELGMIDRTPRVIGVQAEGSAPIAASYAKYDGISVEIDDIEAETVADSICVGKPRDIVKAVKYVHANGGEFITVSDEQIMAAIATMARRTGVFPEPAGAAPFAGMLKMAEQGTIDGKRAAVMVTGNGLKDIVTARRVAGTAIEIEPSLTAVKEHL